MMNQSISDVTCPQKRVADTEVNRKNKLNIEVVLCNKCDLRVIFFITHSIPQGVVKK